MGRQNARFFVYIGGICLVSSLYLFYTISTINVSDDNTVTIKLLIPFKNKRPQVIKSRDDARNVKPDDEEEWVEDQLVVGGRVAANHAWKMRGKNNPRDSRRNGKTRHDDNSEKKEAIKNDKPTGDGNSEKEWMGDQFIKGGREAVQDRLLSLQWGINNNLNADRLIDSHDEDYVQETLYDVHKEPKHKRQQSAKKLILVYTPAFETRVWWDTPTYYDMTDLNGTPCPERRCEVTYDRKRFKDSDAVFFHGRDVRDIDSEKLGELRDLYDKQVWIWAFMEAPLNLMYDPTPYDSVFDWTATYSINSDLWTPYFKVVRLQQDEKKPSKKRNYAKSKFKMVVGVVSSGCGEFRMQIVRMLKQYVMFDVYGDCGWNFEESQNLPECEKDTRECQQIMSSYKFIFALENSYCDEYVTEKYYQNGLLQGLVPIVAITAKFKHKKNYYIPGSYINILDFKDTRALADHLTYLNGNDTAYSQYFRWKRKYKIVLGPHRACLACEKLWREEEEKEGKTISNKKTLQKRKRLDLTNFWTPNVCEVWQGTPPAFIHKYALH